jgi:HlyD family secretion protein
MQKPGKLLLKKPRSPGYKRSYAPKRLRNKPRVARAKAELRNAEKAYQRYQTLYQEGAVSAFTLDEKRQNFETTLAKLNEANAQLENTKSTLQEQILQEQATLDKLKEVRPVDVQGARSPTQICPNPSRTGEG